MLKPTKTISKVTADAFLDEVEQAKYNQNLLVVIFHNFEKPTATFIECRFFFNLDNYNKAFLFPIHLHAPALAMSDWLIINLGATSRPSRGCTRCCRAAEAK